MSCFRLQQRIRDLCQPIQSRLTEHWTWVVTVAVFIVYFFIGGFMYNYCILFVKLQDQFHANDALTGWMGSLLLSLACLSSPVSINLIHRRSPRFMAVIGVLTCGLATLISSYIRDFFALYITFSVFFGIGANFVYQSTGMLLLMDSHSDSSMKASDIATTGTTLGIMVLSPSLEYMMTLHGWRYALRAIAVIILTVCLAFCTVLVKPEQEKIRQLREQLRHRAMIERGIYPEHQLHHGDNKRIEIRHSRDMWLFTGAYVLAAMAWTFIVIFSVSFVTESAGLETKNGALLIFVYAAMTLVGKYLLYLANKYIPLSRLYLLVLANLLSSIASFCLLFSRTIGQLVPLFMLFGVLMAVFQGMPYAAAVELFVDARSSELSSLVMLGCGIGLMIGGPLAGGMYDQTGNYNATVLLTASLFILSTILYVMIPIRRTLHSRKQRRLEAKALAANKARISQPRFPGCRCHLMLVGHEEQLSVFDNISTV